MLRGATGISWKPAFALGIFGAMFIRQPSGSNEAVACTAVLMVRCGILGGSGAAIDGDTDRHEAVAMAY